MKHSLALAAAAFGVLAATGAGACAHADPQPPPGPAETAAPQQDTPCGQDVDGALTPADTAQTGNDRLLLQCQDGTWRAFGDPYPSSDRWLTTGPAVIVHGQGRRNPEARAGMWTGSPLTAESACGVEVVDVVGAGVTSDPETVSADPGRPLTFEVSDHMFTAKFSGYCLWQRG